MLFFTIKDNTNIPFLSQTEQFHNQPTTFHTVQNANIYKQSWEIKLTYYTPLIAHTTPLYQVLSLIFMLCCSLSWVLHPGSPVSMI